MHAIAIIIFLGLCGSTFYLWCGCSTTGFSVLSTIIIPTISPCYIGVGDWTTSGCATKSITSDGIVTCSSNHLTNFAVLAVSR